MEIDRQEAIAAIIQLIPQLDDSELKELVNAYELEVSPIYRSLEDVKEALRICAGIDSKDFLIHCEECPFHDLPKGECDDILKANALYYLSEME